VGAQKKGHQKEEVVVNLGEDYRGMLKSSRRYHTFPKKKGEKTEKKMLSEKRTRKKS